MSREILLYLHFVRTGVFDRIRVFSYHGGDTDYVKRLAATDPVYHKVEVVAPSGSHERTGMARIVWSLWGPIRHRSAIARSYALKTNQGSGSWSAILSHWLTGRPLIFRMGYLLSRRLRKNGDMMLSRLARVIERVACRVASYVLVSSRNAAGHLGVDQAVAEKLMITPTYVDVNLFKPNTVYDFSRPIIAIGRLTSMKNLANLIRACASIGQALTLVGKGDVEEELRALAAEIGADVRFVGQIQNDQLARMLNEHTVFVIPSLHEGLPKVLIEAMACGLVCVGSNIPGVTDLIEDGKTGYLIQGFEAEDIADALRRVNGEQRADVGRAARALIEDKFSLECYATREAKMYGTLG